MGMGSQFMMWGVLTILCGGMLMSTTVFIWRRIHHLTTRSSLQTRDEPVVSIPMYSTRGSGEAVELAQVAGSPATNDALKFGVILNPGDQNPQIAVPVHNTQTQTII